MQNVPVDFGWQDEWRFEAGARTAELKLARALDRSNELGAILEQRVRLKQRLPIEEESKVDDPRQGVQLAVSCPARLKRAVGEPGRVDRVRRFIERREGAFRQIREPRT